VESLARERPEVGIIAGRAFYPSDTSSPVSASEKLVDPGQSVGGWGGIAFVADAGFAKDRLHDGLPMWGVDGHILPKRDCMAFHFNETVNLTQNAPRIEDERSKAESGQPNNPINRTQAIRPSQVIGALDLQTKKRKEKRMTRPTAGGKIEEPFFSVLRMKALNGKYSV